MRVLLAVIAVALALSGCARRSRTPRATSPSITPVVAQSTEEPRLGDRLDGVSPSQTLEVTGSGGLEPSYLLRHRGILFTVCAHSDLRITYIRTSDASFSTPDGVRVGDSLASVRAASPEPVVHERGWAHYVRLPSGWNAGFAEDTLDAHGGSAASPRVDFLFQRGRYISTAPPN